MSKNWDTRNRLRKRDSIAVNMVMSFRILVYEGSGRRR